MTLPVSKLTTQGQISVPAEIRRKLGVGPGSVLEWEEAGDHVIVRRAAQYSFGDVHAVLFPEGPPKHRTLEELKEGRATYVKRRRARG